jgi:predicted RecA/RadA family phage recombinase
MKNFVQPGQYGVPVVTPNAVVSGQVVVIGSLYGIAATDAAAGATVSLAMEGVYTLPKVPGDAYTAGAVAKIDATGTVNAAGAVGAIGWITQAAAAGSTTCSVRLVPSVASPALMSVAESERHPVREPEHAGSGKRH